MNLLKNPYALAALVALYFGVAWFFPWERFQVDSTISVSYVWDALFALVIGLLYKLPLSSGTFSGVFPRIVAIIALAGASLFFLQLAAYPAPFRYLERPILQLLVLAPLLEEFVFRYAFLGASLNSLGSKNKALLLGAVLFSLSHVPAIWHLPNEFRPFVAVQLIYTFAMGWVIGKSRVRTGGVLEPVLLHLVFNLCFYLAMVKGWI